MHDTKIVKNEISGLFEVLGAAPVMELLPGKTRKTARPVVMYVQGLSRAEIYKPLLDTLTAAGYTDETLYDRARRIGKKQHKYCIALESGAPKMYKLEIKGPAGNVVILYAVENVTSARDEEAEAIIEELYKMAEGYYPTIAAFSRAIWERHPEHKQYRDDKQLKLELYGEEKSVADYCRPAYFGGWLYCRPGVVNESGTTYDCNSLYPSVMAERIPGNSYYLELETLEECERYSESHCVYIHFMTMFHVKHNKIPFISVPLDWGGALRNRETSKIEHDGNVYNNPVEFTLTFPEYELFREHYDFEGFEFIDGLAFPETRMNWFVDELYEKKRTLTPGAERKAVKAVLNSISGSFNRREYAKDIRYKNGVPVIEKVKVKGYAHISIGAWITSLARVKIIKKAQENYENFLYTDTDSIHVRGTAVGIPVSDKLGEFKIEREWTRAEFLGEKQYIEVAGENTRVCFSGVPAEITDKIKRQIIERYRDENRESF